MKLLKKTISILVILSICWLGYVTQHFYYAESQQIEAGFLLIHSLIPFTAILAYRISLINNIKFSPVNLLFLFGVLALNLILWLSPSTISTLWTWLLAFMTLLLFGCISSLIEGSNKSANIIRYSVWGTAIYLITLIIFKNDSPIAYLALTFILTVVSLISIFGLFGKSSHKK
ncbi:MAG: hypothetical protein MK066_08905 [Crocinitomicaceae bacterium]|nr:hypothetical protein [Crocinitomicaceae bacterium]